MSILKKWLRPVYLLFYAGLILIVGGVAFMQYWMKYDAAKNLESNKMALMFWGALCIALTGSLLLIWSQILMICSTLSAARKCRYSGKIFSKEELAPISTMVFLIGFWGLFWGKLLGIGIGAPIVIAAAFYSNRILGVSSLVFTIAFIIMGLGLFSLIVLMYIYIKNKKNQKEKKQA